VIVRPVLCRPFVGRLEELEYLRERRLEAASSHGGLVFIGGDAGVGKSRLISEFCASLANSRWKIGVGACLEVANRPNGPLLDALARVGGGFFEIGAAQTQHEQFDAIIDQLATVAARAALVVVIEDVHWADAATLALLAYLGSKLHRMRILVLASLRTDDLHAGHPASAAIAKITRDASAGRIDLGPLRGLELKRFIDEALAGNELPDVMRRAIALTGDGNPFFTEELLKNAVERNGSWHSDKKRTLPQTVRDTLLERLRPFDDAERRVVTQAAVIGRTFSLQLLATTLEANPDDQLPVLRRARDFQLVEELTPTVFRFRHGLTRDAIYGGFLTAEARPRHRTIALALEEVPAEERSLEALAYHWWAAGAKTEAARYNEEAGDAAARVHAHEDAIGFYQRVLELSQIEPIRRGSVLEKIADAHLALAWSEEALASFGAAADAFQEAGAHDAEARCRVRAAVSAYVLAVPEPKRPLNDMLARLDRGESLARSRVHIGLAWLAASSWFPSEAERHLAQVDSHALIAVPDIGLRFHNISAWIAMTLGDLERFRREHAAWVEAARALASPPSLAAAYFNGATCFTIFSLHDEALQNVQLALRVARGARNRHAEESAHALSASCYFMQGDLSRARAAVEAVPATTENKVNIGYVSAWGTLAGLYLDDHDLIARCFDRFEAVVSAAPEIETAAAFAEVMVRRGRHRDAAAFLQRAIPNRELLRGNALTLLAAGRYAAPADRARAREYLVRASGGSVEMLERPALALFDAEACMRDGHPAAARVLGLEAATAFRRLRTPLLEAAALEVAGDREAALSLFRQCGATYDVRRLEPASTLARSAPPGGAEIGRELSPREREVAQLAAAGRSNREIASQLYIAQKTVEKHLASAFQKMGISSRAKLG
jgi:DNA-binding CsgD family transcriptional regulator